MLWLKEKHYCCYNSLDPLANDHYDLSSVMSYNSFDPLPIILTRFPQLVDKYRDGKLVSVLQLLYFLSIFRAHPFNPAVSHCACKT